MAIYHSKGRISAMSEVQSGTSKNGYQWQRMTIVLDVPGYQGSVTRQSFQVTGDDVDDVLLYSIGDQVEVSWTLYAREWNGKWYNNVELFSIEKPDGVTNETPAPVQAARESDTDELNPAKHDDLPF